VVPLAPRVASLQGKTIALLWDYVYRGDEIFPVVQEALARRFPGVQFVGYDVFGPTFGGREHQTITALPAKLRQHRVEAVISATGC
jgi:hypothetical protein